MIIGSKELEAKLDKISKINMKAGVSEAIELVQTAAEMNVHVRTGELRGSIFADVQETEDKIVGTCYTDKAYGIYVEFGTGPKGQENHKGISPEVPVSYRQSPWWIHEGDGDNEIDREKAESYHMFHIDTPEGRFYQSRGQPAYPYLYPALKDNEKKIERIISERIKEQL